MPQAEALIQSVYKPHGRLEWSATDEATLFRDSHVVGVPMSFKNGKRFTRKAEDGNRVFIASADFQSNGFVLVTASVSLKAKDAPNLTRAQRLHALEIDPDLERACANQTGMVRFQNQWFTLEDGASNFSGSSTLACSFELKN